MKDRNRFQAVFFAGSLAFSFAHVGAESASVPQPEADTKTAFARVECEGFYTNHLQGICTDARGAIFWSWTDVLVRTDRRGRLLKRVNVANHHGDLCLLAGKVCVAVNLGKFNLPAGSADSWVYVYDADTLAELARHPIPELVHGAGGIAHHAGRFIVVGGLPPGTDENYLYEYDSNFRFQKRHVLTSGYTLMGIQTAEYAEGSWWFGCYGDPKWLLRADAHFQQTGRWKFDASLGISGVGQGSFLIGQNTRQRDGRFQGRVVVARFTEEAGLIVEPGKD